MFGFCNELRFVLKQYEFLMLVMNGKLLSFIEDDTRLWFLYLNIYKFVARTLGVQAYGEGLKEDCAP